MSPIAEPNSNGQNRLTTKVYWPGRARASTKLKARRGDAGYAATRPGALGEGLALLSAEKGGVIVKPTLVGDSLVPL